MKCINCGKELVSGQKFCDNCGTEVITSQNDVQSDNGVYNTYVYNSMSFDKTVKLPVYLKWPFILAMYIFFAAFPVIPVIFNVLRISFNKKHPEFKNNGGKKVGIVIAAYLFAVLVISVSLSIVDTKRYDETKSALDGKNYELAYELLNKNYNNKSDSVAINLWYSYYCGVGECDTAAELYLDKIESLTVIVNCEQMIGYVEEIKDELSDENLKRLKKIKIEYEKQVKEAETTETTEVAKKETTTETTVNSIQKGADDKQKEISEKDKQKVIDFISDNIFVSNLKEREAKKIAERVTEEQFYDIWIDLLKEDVDGYETPSENFINVIKSYCKVYRSVWYDSEKIQELEVETDILEMCMKECDALVSKIGMDISYYEYRTGLFYITHKYSDSEFSSELGFLKNPKNWKRWAVTNVQYVYTTAISGDNDYVLLTPLEQNFPDSGAYNIGYLDIGKTVTLEDLYGFVKSVPVYIMVDSEFTDLFDQRDSKEKDRQYLFNIVKNIVTGKNNRDAETYKYIDAAPEWVFNGSVALPYKVCTDGSTLNIRSGCGAEYDIVGTLEDGCDILVLDTFNGWSYIIGSYGVDGWVSGNQYADVYGWVSRDYLEVIPFSP